MKKLILMGLLGFFFTAAAQAGVPMWTIEPVPGYPNSINLNPTKQATIKYTVTNQSTRRKVLHMSPIHGITSSGCDIALGYHDSCILTLIVDGSTLRGHVAEGPVMCEPNNIQCYQPAPQNRLAIRLAASSLEPTVVNLALSMSCLPGSSCTATQNAALTGYTRELTFQSPVPATSVTFKSQGLPSGTIITYADCFSFDGGQRCTIQITPGTVASSDLKADPCTVGTSPIPGIVEAVAENGDIVAEMNVYILGYGCQYQGGYLFSIDDTLSMFGSIGGKVLTVIDQSSPNGTPWDSSGGCSGLGGCYTTNATSLTNGSNTPTGNTYLIYNTLTTTNAENPTTYAAGLCTQAIDNTGTVCTSESLPTCYSDWYLPAYCEMSYVNGVGANPCGTQSAPAMQNIQSNLIDTNIITMPGISLYPNQYYSSTEDDQTYAATPVLLANQSGSGSAEKNLPLAVRCTRALTATS